MSTSRRHFLRAAAAAPAWLGARLAPAAPILSSSDHGLSYARAARGNAWLEVDARGFERNIAELRALLGPAPQICAVMKADAYGHGIDLLMPSILRAGIHCIGLASNEEARVARVLGFRGRLLRLRTATLDEIDDARAWRVEEIVGNAELAGQMSRRALRRQRRLKVHFMLNSTGMDRNGLELGTEDGKADARRILQLPGLDIIALMSHFPVEDVTDIASSLARFKEDADWVLGAGALRRERLTLHLANSYAALNAPDARLDMVRTGGALYGDTDPRFAQFRRIMTFKSRVAALGHYREGSTVNYDRTFRLARDSWLANIPVGYSDGYRRTFSHANQPQADATQAYVLVGGHRLPIVGRVTMNTIMADATDIRDSVRIGDEVVLYGRQGQDEITQDALEKVAYTIGGDFYTVWGNSLPKVLKPD